MSAKKKSARSDWIKCQACGVLITNRDLSKHKATCSRGVPRSPGSPTVFSPASRGGGDGGDAHDGSAEVRLEYGCIRSGVLYGEVCLQAEKGNEKLPSPVWPGLIHLSPDTMQLCQLCIGRPVLLTSLQSGTRLVGTAWPVSGFPAASVGIDAGLKRANGLAGAGLVRVEAVTGPVLSAAEVKMFAPSKGKFLQTPEFRQYFLRSVQGRCLLPGLLLSINYYGKPVVSQVLQITRQDQSIVSIDQPPYATQPRLRRASESSESDPASSDQGESILDLSRTENSQTSASFSGMSKRKGSDDLPSDLSRSLLATPDRSSEVRPSSASFSGNVSTSTPKRISRGDPVEGLSESLTGLSIGVSPQTPSAPRLGDDGFARSSELVFSSVAADTELVFAASLEESCGSEEEEEAKRHLVTYDKIGGLSRQLKTIRETLELPLKNPEFFKSLGICPPRGILMFGPPGVGKTMIARAVANEVGAHVTIINGPEVMSKFYGESEARLRSIFQQAAKSAPSLIFIDELDALCPHRERVQSDLEKRIVATLLTLMDGVDAMATRGHLMVLGATNRPDAIDPALRRPGRFDREIEIGVPNAADRADILAKCLHRVPHELAEADLAKVADNVHGYVGADLAAVCQEAAVRAFERKKGQLSDAQLKDNVCVSVGDMVLALKSVRPSAMREVEIKVPRVRWTDIGGQSAVKQKLRQAVEWPLTRPEAFQRMGITPPRGILMYGPPGCSKTLIAKALATESGLNFIAVKGPELFNKWVGESERAVREVFRKARMAAPSIIFFDEIDALAVERGSSSGGNSVADRVLGQLLTEMDGVEKLQDVTIVAATNRPDMIDKALLRPGRLDRILYIPLPDPETREDIFRIQFRSMPVMPDVDVETLVGKTERFSGAEVVAVCREAGLAAMQEDMDIAGIHARHFWQALETVKPRTSDQLIEFYQEYRQNSGLHSI